MTDEQQALFEAYLTAVNEYTALSNEAAELESKASAARAKSAASYRHVDKAWKAFVAATDSITGDMVNELANRMMQLIVKR